MENVLNIKPEFVNTADLDRNAQIIILGILNGKPNEAIAKAIDTYDQRMRHKTHRLYERLGLNSERRSSLIDCALQHGIAVRISDKHLFTFSLLKSERHAAIDAYASGLNKQGVASKLGLSSATSGKRITGVQKSFEARNEVHAGVIYRAVQIHEGEFEAPASTVEIG